MGILKKHKGGIERFASSLLELVHLDAEIVNKTTDPFEFFSAYDSMISTLKALVDLEKKMKFSAALPSEDLKRIMAMKESHIASFIERSYAHMVSSFPPYYPSQTKWERAQNYFTLMEIQIDKMFPSNIQRLEQLKGSLEISLLSSGGAIQITRTRTERERQQRAECEENSQLQKAKSTNDIRFPDWYITITFGKSSSPSYNKAVFMAKRAPQYHEQFNDGEILHQAIYSQKPKDFIQFIALYEFVGNWKSAFVFINGIMMDKQILKGIINCYGSKCRSNELEYCYGGYGSKINPLACRYIGISRWHNQWWSFYQKQGYFYYLDKRTIKEMIDGTMKTKGFCPAFDYNKIKSELKSLPDKVTTKQLEEIVQNHNIGYHGFDGSLF